MSPVRSTPPTLRSVPEADGSVRRQADQALADYARELEARLVAPSGASAPPAAAGLEPRFEREVEGMLKAARTHLGLEVAWLSEFAEDEMTLRALEGETGSFGVTSGLALPLESSFCVRVVDGRLPAVLSDAARDPRTRSLPISRLLGAYVGAPVTLADGRVYGMLCAASHGARPALVQRDAGILRVLATLIAERLDGSAAEAEQRRIDTEAAGVAALLAALEARDHYTGEHSHAVVELSGAAARAMGLDAREVAEIEQVALLHDVGKIGIPDYVLRKAGPLTPLEWQLVRQHSALGGRIVASIGSLAHLELAVRAEHERWDGAGYPDGLSGEAIPLASRIILAADAYHAMTSDRPYRSAMAPADAIAELEANAGAQFDPRVVAALVSVLPGD